MTRIGNYAFSGCTGLTSVTIPNSVTSIGEDVFNGCSNITSVEVDCTTINNWFADSKAKVQILTLGESVTTINANSFEGFSALKTITMGSNVATIGEQAFANCGKLVDVYCYAVRYPTVERNTFENSYLDYVTLHVPAESVNQYKAHEVWGKFKEVKSLPIPTHKLTYIVDGEEYKSYDVEEGATIIPETAPTKEGYTFSGWSEIPETMPANDVTVTGTFSINSYKLIYMVDGEEYKSYDVEYGATITPEVAPTKEGYTFSGWSEIPETMPANDVTVTGMFTLDTGIDQIMGSENGDAMIFTIDGKRVDNLKKGLYVIRMKDGTTRKVVVK